MSFKKGLLFNVIHSGTAVQGSQEGVISLSDYYTARDANRRRYQILVAEDNAVNQRVIVGILERAGHRVRVVTTWSRRSMSLRTSASTWSSWISTCPSSAG